MIKLYRKLKIYIYDLTDIHNPTKKSFDKMTVSLSLFCSKLLIIIQGRNQVSTLCHINNKMLSFGGSCGI